MDWDGIGGEGVEHDQVVLHRHCRKCQPRIAKHDLCRRRAGREEAKIFRIARDPNDFRIYLKERPLLTLAGVAGKTAGSQSNGSDISELAARAACSLDRVRYRPTGVVVSNRLGSPRN